MTESWRKFNSPKPGKRLQDVELILRFYSLFEEKYLGYKAPMRDWLNSSMEENLNSGLDDNFKQKFELINNLIFDKIGINAFKGNGRSFNRSIFDALMVGISICLKQDNLTNNLKEQFDKLLNNAEFQDYLIEGTTDPRKVIGRIKLTIEYFKNE